MGDSLGIQRFHSAIGHTVILSVDDVEVFAGVDRSLGDLAGFFRIPAVSAGAFTDDGPVVGFRALGFQSAGTAQLCSAAQLSLDVQDLVLFQTQALQPGHSGLAFDVHVGNDSSGVEGRISIYHTVEEEHADAGIFRFLQHFVPSVSVSSGNQDVLYTVSNEAAGRVQLFVSGGSGHEGSIIAVLGGKGVGHVLHVGFTISGFSGIQIDDADFDSVRQSGSGAQHHDQSEYQSKNLLHRFSPPLIFLAFLPFAHIIEKNLC